ncbi:hypothetical protein AG0111_0g1675 [Alternaria gaisen]|uniref:Uncharacterized protein n=1 Tax=Alternaria gaisen TaxID=167740 RepID=A0ACB6G0F2_9PLEO|nr:hypothetical protein AG0111_0g1675 [Alternaria gaisen]
MYHSEFSKAESACLKIPLDFLAAAEADQDPQLAAELWKKGGNGVAGTCVPIVYSPRLVDSQLAYRVNVEVIGKRECRTSVRQHLRNIIDGFDDSGGSFSLADDEGPESITVFKNLFHGYSEFASDDAIFAFLEFKHDASDPPSSAEQERIIDTCISWADERRLETAAKFPIYPDDVTELWSKKAPFANDETTMVNTELDFNPTLLVGRIKIFGEFRVRYSIGDCPGLEDINKDCETKAERYLQDCKAVIVVEEIIRAGDSKFLKRFLKDCHENRPDQRIFIVLTKGDTGLNSADRLKISFKEHEIADLDWLARHKEEVGRAKDNYKPVQFEERERYACEIAYIELEEREIRAGERSRRIEDLLKSRYAGISDNLIVKTTCAHDYMRHIQGYCRFTTHDLPLSVESTQIPSLVEELADIANERVKDDLKRLHKQTLPELFSSVRLLGITTSITARARPRFNFHKYEELFMARLQARFDTIEEKEIRPIEAAIQGAIPSWKREARGCFSEWQNLSYQSVRCFLNKQGNHRVKEKLKSVRSTDPKPSWNKELLCPIKKTMNPLFEELWKGFIIATNILASNLAENVNDFLRELNESTKYLGNENFTANLQHRRPQLNNMFKKQLYLIETIRYLRGRFTGDLNGDYFPDAMAKHYMATLQAEAESGTKPGSLWASRLRTFKNRVCGTDSPYKCLLTMFRSDWKELKKECLEGGKLATETDMKEIKASYEQIGTSERQNSAVMMTRPDL